jgi:hypothetical protein
MNTHLLFASLSHVALVASMGAGAVLVPAARWRRAS